MLDGMTTYDIHTDVKYGPLEVIEAGHLADTCPEKWWNQTLCRVNDCVARLGVFEGEFHFHVHEREDELFYVIEGTLYLDFEGRTVALGPRQAMMVPRGVTHRTRAPGRTVVLMVEAASVVPTGDA
jgi:mannose-6-phosphate isomerase-like protein (cupin superfamily)